jgi:hypothetical protein
MVAALWALALLCQVSAAETIQLGGRELSVVVEKPEGKGPFPLLVIAPAKEYTMKGRLFERLARGAVALGYAAVRFDWGFVSRKAAPSAGLEAENADLAAVVDHFAAQSWADRARVVVEAKSLGSRAAMVGAHARASALLLWTPNCSAAAPFEATYAPILGSQRPVHVAISAADPYCDLAQIYAAAPKLGSKVTLSILGGDHNFLHGEGGATRDEDAAIASSLAWLERVREGKW